MDGCAHLYGEFGAANVEDAKQFSRSEVGGGGGEESWATVMTHQHGEHTWLEYMS